MHLLNIIVYWYAPNTTCVQVIFQVHSTQTDELINSMCVYIPISRRYETHHGLYGGEGVTRICEHKLLGLG